MNMEMQHEEKTLTDIFALPELLVLLPGEDTESVGTKVVTLNIHLVRRKPERYRKYVPGPGEGWRGRSHSCIRRRMQEQC